MKILARSIIGITCGFAAGKYIVEGILYHNLLNVVLGLIIISAFMIMNFEKHDSK